MRRFFAARRKIVMRTKKRWKMRLPSARFGAAATFCLAMAGAVCGDAGEAAPRVKLTVEPGHPWTPPFGLDRVGRPMDAVVEVPAGAKPTAEYVVVAYRNGKEIGRRTVTLLAAPSPGTAGRFGRVDAGRMAVGRGAAGEGRLAEQSDRRSAGAGRAAGVRGRCGGAARRGDPPRRPGNDPGAGRLAALGGRAEGGGRGGGAESLRRCVRSRRDRLVRIGPGPPGENRSGFEPGAQDASQAGHGPRLEDAQAGYPARSHRGWDGQGDVAEGHPRDADPRSAANGRPSARSIQSSVTIRRSPLREESPSTTRTVGTRSYTMSWCSSRTGRDSFSGGDRRIARFGRAGPTRASPTNGRRFRASTWSAPGTASSRSRTRSCVTAGSRSLSRRPPGSTHDGATNPATWTTRSGATSPPRTTTSTPTAWGRG